MQVAIKFSALPGPRDPDKQKYDIALVKEADILKKLIGKPHVVQ